MFDDTLMKIAETLADCCRNGRESEALDTLYAPDAVSIEALSFNGDDPMTVGLEGIRGKHDWWNGAFDVHASSVGGPYFHGSDTFALTFEVDATNRESGERSAMKEIGIYTIAKGKIIRESFFYTTG